MAVLFNFKTIGGVCLSSQAPRWRGQQADDRSPNGRIWRRRSRQFLSPVPADRQADYQISNYVDKPDLTMNQLIAGVTSALGREDKLIHIPYWPGMCGVALLDFAGKVSRHKFAISRAKVRKFCATAQFTTHEPSHLSPR